MAIEYLEILIDDYIKTVETLKPKSAFGGMFGFGGGTRDDPCHFEFYETFKTAIENDCEDDPYEICKLLITAERKGAPDKARFMLTALQRLAIPLVDRLTTEQKSEFIEYFDENIPRRMRLPIQKDLYKALKD